MTDYSQIENELTAIKRGDARSWGRVSALLEQIDSSGYWSTESRSFTEWMEKYAENFGVKQSMLWRHLTSGRYLNKLRGDGKPRKFLIPSLDELPKSVGSESVEILAKLERTLPEKDFEKLLQRLLEGKARRSELRSMWETHRTGLGGKTARGRNTAVPRIDWMDPLQNQQHVDANLLCELKAAGSEWAGIDKPERYDVYLNVTPDGLPSGDIICTLPAVIMVKPVGGTVVYHAVLLGTSPQKLKELAESQLVFADYLWVLLQNPLPDADALADIPKGLGILNIVDGAIRLVTRAERTPKSGARRADLASALLVRSLKR